MARIPRKTQKVFCGDTNAGQIAVFGSMKTGTPVYDTDIETLQSAAYEQGWSEAILNDKAPYLEEMNGVQYGLSSQIAYLLQQGLACEYDANTTYYKGSTVAVINNTSVIYYKSLTNDNKGNPVTDGTNWALDSISKIESYNTTLTNSINTLSSSVVKLTGNQTVAGNKTFTGTSTFTGQVKVPNSNVGGTALRLVEKGAGFIKLGDGTLIQWGNDNNSSSSYTKSVSLYQNFKTDVYRVFLTNTGSNNAAFSDIKVYNLSASSFAIRSSSYSNYFNWLAIGQWY